LVSDESQTAGLMLIVDFNACAGLSLDKKIMETDVRTSRKTLMLIADKLMQTQQEIDELTVQLSLGKAEVRDKFQEIRNEFRVKLSEVKKLISSHTFAEELTEVRAKIDDLENSLKPETIATPAAFEKERNRLLKDTSQLEKLLEKKIPLYEELLGFRHEIEKLKIKMEILWLKFTLKKIDVKNEFTTNMHKAKDYIAHIKRSVDEKVGDTRERYEDFRDEIHLAYDHFRKALRGL
jgi:hypothetical protein